MILKAGTYTFNDVPILTNDLSQNITFEVAGALGTQISVDLDNTDSFGNIFQSISFTREDGESFVVFANVIKNVTNVEPATFWTDDLLKSLTIVEDTEVEDTFGIWYIANTNYNEVNGSTETPLAEITYNGETIAQLNAGETATLSCEGKKMASDVVVKVNEVESKIPEGYIKPEGSLPITENGTYPVIDKEEVVVDVPTTTDGVPVEMLNQAVMNELIAPNSTKGEVGAVYLYHGEASDTYEYGTLYYLEEVSE